MYLCGAASGLQMPCPGILQQQKHEHLICQTAETGKNADNAHLWNISACIFCGSHCKFAQVWAVQVIGQRIPLSAVQLRLQDGNWYTLKVSGDGYWQPIESLSFTQDPNEPIDVKIFCSDGSAPKVDKGIFPSQMLCAYQDPECQAQEGSIQC